MTAPPASLVTVAVPTYRRPEHLRALVPILLAQAREVASGSDGRYDVDVLVVDNDPAGGAAEVLAALAAPDLRYVAEPTPGIAAVRNRALDAAVDSRLLAFIDDDERPGEQWLHLLLDAWQDSGAVAVSGRVLAEYEGDVDPWIRAGDFFTRRSLPSGTEIDVAATGNLLLDLHRLRELGVRFETALGLSGGEDTLFSRAVVRAGGRMVWCDEAVVVDQVPRSRLSRSWVLTRAWSHGNAAMLSELRLTARSWEGIRLRAQGCARGAVRMAGGLARAAWGQVAGSPRHQARGLRTFMRGAGMFAGALGVVYQEYAREGSSRLRLRTLLRTAPGETRP